MRSIKKFVTFLVVVVGTVGLAYVLGGEAAKLLQGRKAEKSIEKTREMGKMQTAAVLEKMGTIAVGDTLQDYMMEDIDGAWHALSDIVTDRTVITYMKANCEVCLYELKGMKEAVGSREDYERFIVVSPSNPLRMREIRDEYGVECLMLFDEERQYGAMMNIQSFPFNIVVNRNLEILEIHGNALLPDDYQRILDKSI